ncbi:MAG: 2-amino-4-hydroxy-6-hydroxymethyldihydropteridine diphosphokinase [Deferribacterota bacterium]|nr:2-amino-4-hydroxy-6-hydroxymethyldihydropteridine diphosphokinase [Deferribacterota bacterium]
MKKAILSLGSNIGDRKAFIKRALQCLSKEITIKKISSIYESCSLLKDGQNDYYNIAISAETNYTPEEFLLFIKEVETSVGRLDRGKWLPREIDIDIIDYNGEVICNEFICIPHKLMHKRSFVLYPLRDICVNYMHPVSRKHINNMINNLSDKLEIKKVGEIYGNFNNL